jgi:hypothetical protein
VVLIPEHTGEGLATIAASSGVPETETVTDAGRLAQPLAVPVTEYTVVKAGDTARGFPEAPVLHKYVVAPEAVNVAEPPGQIAAGLAPAVITGLGTPIMVMVFCPTHPEALVPITV